MLRKNCIIVEARVEASKMRRFSFFTSVGHNRQTRFGGKPIAGAEKSLHTPMTLQSRSGESFSKRYVSSGSERCGMYPGGSPAVDSSNVSSIREGIKSLR